MQAQSDKKEDQIQIEKAKQALQAKIDKAKAESKGNEEDDLYKNAPHGFRRGDSEFSSDTILAHFINDKLEEKKAAAKKEQELMAK